MQPQLYIYLLYTSVFLSVNLYLYLCLSVCLSVLNSGSQCQHHFAVESRCWGWSQPCARLSRSHHQELLNQRAEDGSSLWRGELLHRLVFLCPPRLAVSYWVWDSGKLCVSVVSSRVEHDTCTAIVGDPMYTCECHYTAGMCSLLSSLFGSMFVSWTHSVSLKYSAQFVCLLYLTDQTWSYSPAGHGRLAWLVYIVPDSTY